LPEKFFLLALAPSGTFVISPKNLKRASIEAHTCIEITAMNVLELCLVIQSCLAFGLAGLMWPEKFRPFFEVLLFPWAASYRAVRVNSIAAIVLSGLLLARLVSTLR
jgi:hypothetical protein